MDRFDRIFDLHKLLSASRRPVSRQRIEQELECSRATAKRIIEAMRLYLNAPIEYDRVHNGYYYDAKAGDMYELPGVWFNASELLALLSVQQLLSEMQPGLLERQLAPLKQRISTLLKAQDSTGSEVTQRIRILSAAARPVSHSFQTLASALAQRQQIEIGYYSRGSDQHTTRTLSPQRMTHYRDNWYIDAYCHFRDALRTFSLDRIGSVKPLKQAAMDIPTTELEKHLAGAYGIFSGTPEQIATLRFTPERARWVANEVWHPQQQARWLDDGSYELCIPYSQTPELVMDILKYGPDVEVMAPDELKLEISKRLKQASRLYQSGK